MHFLREAACRSLACYLLTLGLSACGGAAGGGAVEAKVRLDALVEDYFEELLVLQPVYATFIGDGRYNDRLANDISPQHRAQRLALEQRYLALVREIPVEGLPADARLTWDVFVQERQTAIERQRFPEHLLPVDQLYSMPAVLALLGTGDSAQPFSTVRDYENFLGRMRDFPAWADQAIVNMREGISRGVVQPGVVMSAALKQLEDLAVDVPERSIFHQPVANLPAGFGAADRQRLTAAYREMLQESLLPAYRRLAAFVRDEYLPASRDTVAWTALPEGQEWYAFLARAATTTRLTPDAIHELGLAEVARIRAEMEKVKSQVGFTGDLQAFFTQLKEDPAFYFSTPGELIDGYQALKARIAARLPEQFGTLPTVDYEVRPVEAFRAQSAAGASYQPPAPDGSRPGIFYINTYNLRAQPRFGMETLSLHEAAPGHHFQQSIQLSLTSLPRFRRFGGDYVAYVEGWALYAESLGPALGLFTDPYQYYGRLNDEMLRAMRLVVDTGLHTRSWTREQAIRYMLDNSSLAASDVESEVDRYIANPGQALGYKIGEIRIRELRTKAEAALGDRFDVRAFHDELLRDGALPIDVLEAKMDRWLAGRMQP